MVRSICRVVIFVAGLVVGLGGQVLSQESPAKTSTETTTVFGDLVELASKYEVSTSDGTKLLFDEKPILNWTSPTRNEQKGCVFVWSKDGRPEMIGTLFTYVYAGYVNLKHELHSLAPGPLTAIYDEKTAWTPSKPGIAWTEIKNQQLPRATERLRLVQMRAIAREYSATLEEPNGNKQNLELAPQPIFRYSSEKNKILDGAIFSFALGTDPEVLLIIEAIEDEEGQKWQIGFARFHYWKVSVKDSSEAVVWTAEADEQFAMTLFGDRTVMPLIYTSFKIDMQRISN